MPLDHQITCIKKADRYNPNERIERIGGNTGGESGGAWSLSEDQAIQGIESGKWNFWVSVAGKGVWVMIATHLGRKYLKTEADGFLANNLLSLPEGA